MSANKLNDVIEHYKRHINRATEANDNEKVSNFVNAHNSFVFTCLYVQYEYHYNSSA